MSRSVDGVVGVEHFAIEDRRVFAAHGDGPGVCDRQIGARLVGIENADTAQGAVGVERDGGGCVFGAGVGGEQRAGAVIRELGVSLVAHAVMRGDGSEDAFQRDGGWNAQAVSEQIFPDRQVQRSTAFGGDRVHRGLDGGGVVGDAVAGDGVG